MLRPVWTGSISFGLVAIPVKAVTAQAPKDIRFNLLHKPCHSRLLTKRYCPSCNEDVSDEDTVRGFAYTKGDYVIMEDQDLDGIATPAKHSIQILDFVDMSEVDPVYFEKPYYLRPSEGGERTYALLHKAMTDSGRVGVGRVALREREHLALIRPVEHALVMETLAFPDEVRTVEEAVQPIDVQVDDRELQMAHSLIEAMAASFDPGKYRDEYRDSLTKLIQSKVEKGPAPAKPAAPAAAKGQVVDLIEMLRKSVDTVTAQTEQVEKPAARSRKGGPKQAA